MGRHIEELLRLHRMKTAAARVGSSDNDPAARFRPSEWLCRFTHSPGAQALLLAVVTVVAPACEAADPNLVSPNDDGGDSNFPTVVVDAEVRDQDQTLAAALGWMEGVPNTEIRYRRHGSDEWSSTATDGAGRAVLEEMSPGLWHIYGGRRLTPPEIENLDTQIRALGDGLVTEVQAGSSGDTIQISLALAADRPKDLVISEFNSGVPPFTEFPSPSVNQQGKYMELYNNSNRTLNLDGRLLLDGEFLGFSPTARSTCGDSEVPRTDANGLLTLRGLRFPGSGSEYPVAPGEAVVIAAAALDHTAQHPEMPDLSDADFELPATVSADNPDVPDMLQVGSLARRFGPEDFVRGTTVWFIADPVELEALPIVYRDHTGRGYVRVSADDVLDAVGSWFWWPEMERGATGEPCEPFIHPDFERHFTYVPNDETVGVQAWSTHSLQRRIVDTDGRRVLMNTNTSAVDFAYHERSPGFVPEALIDGIGLGMEP